jgi:hypothetical protein
MWIRLIYAAIVLFFSINCFAQVERVHIIENKIRSVKTTTYMQGDSLNRVVVQHLYSKTGDDSVIFFNGALSFRFVATKDATGRVSQLDRFDSKNQRDEAHMYTYNKNGSYSIEIIAQGAGRISLAKYDKKNICMEEEIDASYTLVYVRNSNGKTEKILSKEKDNKTETIAVFYFDKNGLAIRGEGTTDGGKNIYFKYNDKKLVSEIKTVGKNEDDKEGTEIILLEYDFYEN